MQMHIIVSKLQTAIEATPYLGNLRQEFEFSILKHVAAHMIRPQVVDLLLEDSAPKVFAEELHHLQLILETRRVLGETLDETLANLKAQVLQFGNAVGEGEVKMSLCVCVSA